MRVTSFVLPGIKDTRIEPRLELILTICATLLMVGAFAVYFDYAVALQYGRSGYAAFESALFALIMILFSYGALVYCLSRIGYLVRLAGHRGATQDELDAFCHGPELPPSLTILIPSYKEEPRTIYQTLFSAATQQYPEKKVVLLLDDPAEPATAEDRRLREKAIDHVADVQEVLDEQHAWLERQIKRVEHLKKQGTEVKQQRVLKAYDKVIDWFERTKRETDIKDHTDRLFLSVCVERVIEHLKEMRRRAQNAPMTYERALVEYRRLASHFSTRITYFERKRYANLSHEPNKAMNLNSYIHLMGKRWTEQTIQGDMHLVEDEVEGTLFPDSEFLVTLDADSLLTHDYAIRLIHHLNRPENQRIAVIQTPYSSVPDAQSKLERLAGATTDIQYIIHQGFTWFNATYWVGANAVLRKQALHDIEVDEQLGNGHAVRKFVSDTTMIEDTESSIDLVHKGWQLYNYPRRLSFSATPPDFGSLLIQRRRWANGGLIILPKLLLHLANNIHRPHYSVPSGLMRLHYLISLGMVNIGTLVLLLYPFGDGLLHYGVIAIAFLYFSLYARDLSQTGYRVADVLRVYALNLMLVPVTLGGVAKSIQQVVLGKKLPFSRTPKIGERMAAPKFYLAVLFLMPAFFGLVLISDVILQNWAHGTFTVLNGTAFSYAVWLTNPRLSLQELLGQTQRDTGTSKSVASDKEASSSPIRG